MDDRGDRWTSMEATNDPDWFVRFLDSTSTRPGEHHPAVALLELGPISGAWMSGAASARTLGRSLGCPARRWSAST